MARVINPFRGVVELFKGLSGGYDDELDDEIIDEGLKQQLEEIENVSAKNLRALESRSGEQTMTIEDEKETDRLGIKKPKKAGKVIAQGQKAKEAQEESDREDNKAGFDRE